MALAVPLSRFTPRVGGGSAFFVRRLDVVARYKFMPSKDQPNPKSEIENLRALDKAKDIKIAELTKQLETSAKIVAVHKKTDAKQWGAETWGEVPKTN